MIRKRSWLRWGSWMNAISGYWVLCFQVGEELLIITGMDGRRHSISPLCQHGKHPVVNKVVN